MESLDGQIYQCDQRLASLLEKRNELGKGGKINTDEWNKVNDDIAAANVNLDALRQNARQSIQQNIEVDSNITEKQEEVNNLKAQCKYIHPL